MHYIDSFAVLVQNIEDSEPAGTDPNQTAWKHEKEDDQGVEQSATFGVTGMYALHRDYLGSLTAITNSDGRVVQQHWWSVFGRERSHPSVDTHNNSTTEEDSPRPSPHRKLLQADGNQAQFKSVPSPLELFISSTLDGASETTLRRQVRLATEGTPPDATKRTYGEIWRGSPGRKHRKGGAIGGRQQQLMAMEPTDDANEGKKALALDAWDAGLVPVVDRLFLGGQYLSRLSLYRLHGRLYDPGLGRFATPDQGHFFIAELNVAPLSLSREHLFASPCPLSQRLNDYSLRCNQPLLPPP